MVKKKSRKKMNFSRKNTVKVNFPIGSIQPTDKEMVDFVLQYGLTTRELHSVYKDINDCCIYIKFNATEDMVNFLTNLQSNINFNYNNGENVKVTISDANVEFIYIRIFNLPPEIEDNSIIEILKKYGPVRSINKEKYPPSLGLDVYTGVRGAFVEMRNEIPNIIYIQRFRARVQYIGQKEVCFLCKLEGHKKSDCPKNNINTKSISDQNNLNKPHSFSVTSFVRSIKKAAPTTVYNNEVESTMTLLGSSSPASRSMISTPVTSEQIKQSSVLELHNQKPEEKSSSINTDADFHHPTSPIKETRNTSSIIVTDLHRFPSPVKENVQINPGSAKITIKPTTRLSTRAIKPAKK